ncbi:alpha-amylase [Clostridiaceae bacterium]|nr:alpha-amylase [Clostridiaceae bacterium]RKI14074.1 alpha-amylase [bacterium 1XD21-70]
MRQYKIDNTDGKAYPLGLTIVDGGIHVSVTAEAEECSLVLFAPSAAHAAGKEDGVFCSIPFPAEKRVGNVWEMTVLGKGLERMEYAFEADGKMFSDPYGHAFTGQEEWGGKDQVHALLRCPVGQEGFDWEGDVPLHIPYEECVVYRIHVRGFTRHSSSKVKDKGTFRGIVEKIPYLKELGVTTLELMPMAEFSEVMAKECYDGPNQRREADGRLNYWGYGSAFNGAPKASYAGKKRRPDLEFKHLVKELHRAGIELVAELFFTGKESPAYVLDMARRWVREYHLDGIHITGDAPAALLAQDPYLAGSKVWASYWEGVAKPSSPKYLGEYNDGFLIDMRRVLKGDEGQMGRLALCSRRNPAAHGIINYMANTNGFTLMDLVCYEQKHNEDNGEKNLDGSDYNYSWNCGVEGPARKKKIVGLRKQQLRNAYLLLFLSQGTPLLMAGDEFGNTQNGNNNAYCQDNAVSWLNWSQLKSNQDLYTFVKFVIAFRKAHPVFRRGTEPRMMDYEMCGFPDVSYHGVRAWVPEFDNFRRQLGILYCGKYGRKPDGTEDDSFFVAYNMHWEPHGFALPHLPKGLRWHLAFDTADDGHNGYYEPGEEPEAGNQKQIMVPPRSILVLIGKEHKQKVQEEQDAHI